MNEFSKAGFLVGCRIMVAAIVFLISGSRLSVLPNDEDGNEWDSIIQHPSFRQYMKIYCLKKNQIYILMASWKIATLGGSSNPGL